MIRVEVITNKAIEEDVIEVLESTGYRDNFTYIPKVFGRGKHGRRESSAVWPEENVLFNIYINDNDLDDVITGLKQLKEKFKTEGLRCYIQKDFEQII